MAVNLSPIGNDAPFIDASGNPLNAGLLYTYVANSGGSTPATTYTTSAGSVQNANPIVLNSNGYPASGGNVVEIWLTSGVSYLFVLKTSAGVTVWSRDNISGINDVSSSFDQWVSGPAPTYISATSFSLVGDQTGTFQGGRRLKTTNSGGTVYSTIKTSAFGVVTTVTVVNDSGTLDSGLSEVSYGLLSPTNPSTPLLADTYPILSGSSDKTKKLRIEVDGNTTDTTRVIAAPDADSIYGDFHGACILAKSGANLVLSPKNGNKIIINSVAYAIPDAGVSLAPPAVASTTYYIYAYMNSGTMTLENSATAYATQAGTGVIIKSGDATRTLVGMARTTSGNAWADTATQRFVRSWFNDPGVGGISSFSTQRTTTSLSYVELNSEIRVEFLIWTGEVAEISASGAGQKSDTANSCQSSIGIDGTTAENVFNAGQSTSASVRWPVGMALVKTGLSEGYHYATFLGMQVSSNTGTCGWDGGAAGAATTINVRLKK